MNTPTATQFFQTANNVARKATCWDDLATAEVDTAGVPVDDEVYTRPAVATPCTSFCDPALPQIFVVTRASGRYLVDTQGYDYARYAVRLA